MRKRQKSGGENHETSVSYILEHIKGVNIRLLVRQARNNHTGLTKVVLKYGLYIDIWAVGFTNHYIYVRGIRKAC